MEEVPFGLLLLLLLFLFFPGGRDPSSGRRPRPDSTPLESPRLSREVLAKLGNRQTKVFYIFKKKAKVFF